MDFFKVEDEYAKDAELKKDDVKILQEWIAKQPHLPKLSDAKLVLFLQSCYYRVEAAKTCIDNYYTVRTHCPEFFAKRNPKYVETQTKLNAITLLPGKSVKGYSVMFTKIMDPSTDNFSFNDMAKLFDMTVSLTLMQIGTSLGHVLVADMEGAAFGHLTKVNIGSVKKYLFFLQEAMPVRIKEIHIINISAITNKVLAMVKPFLKGELIEMLHLHPKLESLYEFVPKEALPKEYGGQIPIKEMHEKQVQNLKDHASFFEDEEKDLSDESKRQGKPKNAGDVFGIEGTFKKLDID